MADLKTTPNKSSVTEYLSTLSADRQGDCKRLVKLMREITGEKPVMWGKSIVGFGSYHYKYASGREGDWFLTGFSSRKESLTVYLMTGFKPFIPELNALGKHKIGSSCLYLKRLEDVDTAVLEQMIRKSVETMRKTSAA